MEQKELYNDLPQAKVLALRKQFDKQKGTYLFKLCQGSTIPVATAAGAIVTKTLYPNTFIRPSDSILGEEGKVHNIGAIERFDKGVPIYYQIPVSSTSDGLFAYTVTNPKDQKIVDFLLASNQFEDNPDRDKSVEAVYRLVDKVAKAQHSNKIRSDKSKAYLFLDKMTEDQVKDFSAAMGWDETEDVQLLTDKIGEMIDKNAGNFIKLYENPSLAYRTTLKKAISANIVTFSPKDNKLTIESTGTVILLDRVHNTDMYEQFEKWVIQKTNGEEVFAQLKSMVYPKAAAKK